MIITINTDILKKLGLSPNEYVVLAAMVQDVSLDLGLGLSYRNLVTKKFVTIDKKGFSIPTPKAQKIFDIPVKGVVKANEGSKKAPSADFIEKFIELFPKGVRSGGYLVRGTRGTIRSKIRSFKRKYPEYSEDLILEVTKRYVERKRRERFQYMMLAPYFIEKNGVSTLAAECEERLSELKSGNIDDKEWGRDI